MVYWKSIQRKLRQVGQLTPADLFLILEAWFALAFFKIALRFMSLERLQRRLCSLPARPIAAKRLSTSPARINYLSGVASGLHPWPPVTCLCRAVTLQWMLARRGILSTLRLGVLNGSSGLHGHAWLELDGAPLGEEPASLARFSVLSPRSNES